MEGTNARERSGGERAALVLSDEDMGLLMHITNFCTDKLLEYQAESTWKRNNNIRWMIPGTNMIATLAVVPSATEAGEYRISLGVNEKGSDVLTSCYMEKGKREALLEYLKTPEARQELAKTLLEMCA